VCSPDVITDIPYREVDRVVFMLTGRNRDSRFITPKDDRDENSSMCIDIYRNELLFTTRLAGVSIFHEMYLRTGPKPSHPT
jgi:hypothetical protein